LLTPPRGNRIEKIRSEEIRREENFVITIKERCRMCYTCVRECPAKAIRIEDGQAEIIKERCISCGNCVRVCSQNAKVIKDTTEEVFGLLDEEQAVAAILAPSFPAAFPNILPERVIGAVRELGFSSVHEVAFGADIVAAHYARLVEKHPEGHYIATTCPAIVNFVERYHPDLTENLAPILSPMTAAAVALRDLYGSHLKIVFIGPCIAKKREEPGTSSDGEINGVITFLELQRMLERRKIDISIASPRDLDPPYANLGALFPISRGILQAADIPEDLVKGAVVAADGKSDFPEAIKEFGTRDMDVHLLEVLCCNGCIMGAGMPCDIPLFRRRALISQYAKKRVDELDPKEWRKYMDRVMGLDYSRTFTPMKVADAQPGDERIEEVLRQLGKFKPEDELDCGACGYDTCREHAIAIIKGLAETEMCLPNTIEQLRRVVRDLAVSNEKLKETQEALVQSEKLASMGQLAAGIAHELNNPLGVVLMYSHLLLEDHGEDPEVKSDLNMISEQADRCKKIVAKLLHFARQNRVTYQEVDIGDVLEKSIRSVTIPENIDVVVEHQHTDSRAEMDEDQMIQVLGNLISNACAAMPEGGTLTLKTGESDSLVSFEVIDTGTGIDKETMQKIFEPFFTTKKMGKGTGLGLSVSYGIVKMHFGDILVESNSNSSEGPTGTTFTVKLPRRGKKRDE
jgi:signal transduction histidine kinase/iron only hydrogenase large subunit-like protein